MVGQCILHHLHQALHRPVWAGRIGQLKPVRHGRAQRFQVELLTFNGGGGQRLLHPQLALHRVSLLQPNGAQQTEQPALFQPGLVQRGGKRCSVKRELWPSAVLPDVAWGAERV